MSKGDHVDIVRTSGASGPGEIEEVGIRALQLGWWIVFDDSKVGPRTATGQLRRWCCGSDQSNLAQVFPDLLANGITNLDGRYVSGQ